MKVTFEDGVLEHIAEIAEHLEQEREGYGDLFVYAIDGLLDHIKQFPKLHEVVHLDYRRAVLTRFQFDAEGSH